MKFNTTISQLMILTNEMEKEPAINPENYKIFLKLLAPVAPHIAEELWHQLGNKDSISKQSWPNYDPVLIIEAEATIVVQVNGKLRDTITVPAEAKEEEIKQKAQASEKVKSFIMGKQIVKIIYVPKKLINLVVK
jgi:leucyl-tRNA synthetase